MERKQIICASCAQPIILRKPQGRTRPEYTIQDDDGLLYHEECGTKLITSHAGLAESYRG